MAHATPFRETSDPPKPLFAKRETSKTYVVKLLEFPEEWIPIALFDKVEHEKTAFFLGTDNFSKGPGVYELRLKRAAEFSHVVYGGHASNLWLRLSQHVQNDKDVVAKLGGKLEDGLWAGAVLSARAIELGSKFDAAATEASMHRQVDYALDYDFSEARSIDGVLAATGGPVPPKVETIPVGSSISGGNKTFQALVRHMLAKPGEAVPAELKLDLDDWNLLALCSRQLCGQSVKYHEQRLQAAKDAHKAQPTPAKQASVTKASKALQKARKSFENASIAHDAAKRACEAAEGRDADALALIAGPRE